MISFCLLWVRLSAVPSVVWLAKLPIASRDQLCDVAAVVIVSCTPSLLASDSVPVNGAKQQGVGRLAINSGCPLRAAPPHFNSRYSLLYLFETKVRESVPIGEFHKLLGAKEGSRC